MNEAERKELGETSAADKLQQLAALMGSVRQLGWTRPLAEEETVVRDRWNRHEAAFDYLRRLRPLFLGTCPNITDLLVVEFET